MKSLARYITGRMVAAELRMLRQVHKGSFLVMEGPMDYKRFRKILAEPDCHVVIGFGKTKVVEAVEVLYEDGFEGLLGIVDADFDRILGVEIRHEGIVVSRTHDFDLDFAHTPALGRYFFEVSEEVNLTSFGGTAGFLEKCMEALRPLSAMRFANVRENLRYDLSRIDLSQFFNGERIDVDRMVEHASSGRFADDASKRALRGRVDYYLTRQLNLAQFTSGHDVCAAIGIALRRILGQRKHETTIRSEVELHLRLALDPDDFSATGVVAAIANWERENYPFRVMRSVPV